MNFGTTVTGRHTDPGNKRTGGCTVTPGGRFNWRLGGHLVLEEPGVVLELAPGDNVIFPSASITHYNMPIKGGEERWSIVGYSSGQLFRHALLQTPEFDGLSKEEVEAALKSTARARVEAGWARYCTLDELRNPPCSKSRAARRNR